MVTILYHGITKIILLAIGTYLKKEKNDVENRCVYWLQIGMKMRYRPTCVLAGEMCLIMYANL